jgi:hypothetical protein
VRQVNSFVPILVDVDLVGRAGDPVATTGGHILYDGVNGHFAVQSLVANELGNHVGLHGRSAGAVDEQDQADHVGQGHSLFYQMANLDEGEAALVGEGSIAAAARRVADDASERDEGADRTQVLRAEHAGQWTEPQAPPTNVIFFCRRFTFNYDFLHKNLNLMLQKILFFLYSTHL